MAVRKIMYSVLRRFCLVAICWSVIGLTVESLARASDASQPTSQGASTIPKAESPENTEIVLRLGNESNPVDGIFGPFTFGPRGSHTFTNGFSVEAGYIRLHEPDTPFFSSVLDEAQLSLRLPETKVANQPLVIGATAWQNRMIDMYTNLGGLEITRTGPIAFFLGFYVGSATRENLASLFTGVQAGPSFTIGPVQLGLSFLGGRIGDSGTYRKTAIEGATDFFKERPLPLSLNFAIEDRFFNFGSGGPVSAPQDEFIFVTGLELHFEKAL